MSSHDELDSEQRAAVCATERAIAVLAGPGSGKTRVLSYRTRHLLETNKGTNALLLTFTNKAAAEMKARAIGVTPGLSKRIRAGTFHNFGLTVLRSHGTHVGIDPDFEILDEDEQRLQAEVAAREAGCRNVARLYSNQRLRQQLAKTDVAAFSEAYESRKRQLGVVDFDDLIVYVARLFQHKPEIAKAYATKYQHILIDEFQDTNKAQFAVVRPLAEHANTISVFADDDQAIFGFAGAETRNISRFCDDLAAREYPLTTNYRCRARIVECANRLISANRSKGRRMKARRPDGDVRVLQFEDAAAEAEFLCGEIEEQIAEGTAAPSISILTRSAYRIEELLTCLRERSIPFSDWLGASYKAREQRALRTGLAVVRPTLNDRSSRLLCGLLGVEERHVRDTKRLLEEHADRPGVDFLLEGHRLALEGAKVSQIVGAIASGIESIDPTIQVGEGIVAEVSAFERHDPEYSVDHLLGDLALGGRGGAPTEGAGVKVATLHRTKGLQWPHVYLVGLEEGTLPDYRADDEAIKEERRLCFVGVCRAEDRLTLTRVEGLNDYEKEPSPFLDEMGMRSPG